jgi:hypothetical protein
MFAPNCARCGGTFVWQQGLVAGDSVVMFLCCATCGGAIAAADPALFTSAGAPSGTMHEELVDVRRKSRNVPPVEASVAKALADSMSNFVRTHLGSKDNLVSVDTTYDKNVASGDDQRFAKSERQIAAGATPAVSTEYKAISEAVPYVYIDEEETVYFAVKVVIEDASTDYVLLRFCARVDNTIAAWSALVWFDDAFETEAAAVQFTNKPALASMIDRVFKTRIVYTARRVGLRGKTRRP